jgi:hypothetical protein
VRGGLINGRSAEFTKRLSAESRFAVCPNRSCEGFAGVDRLSAVKLVATPEGAA